MKNKKSSFQIGNQFNGYGDKIYLKADPVEILPISQADIKLMPDYSQFTLYATGSNPIVLNPKNINLTVNSMLGAVPALSQVTLIKENDNNRYIANYNVTTCGFTDASYSIIRNKNNSDEKKEMLEYFAVTKQSNLIIREDRSINAKALGEVAPGKAFNVITLNGKIVRLDDEDDPKKPKWVKATDGIVEGWVSETYIREDKKRIINLSSYGLNQEIEIRVTFKNETQYSRKRTPSKSWFIVGKGDYGYSCRKVDGRWCVAVGPAIFDYIYPKGGGCEADDIKPFSKFIKVNLQHMVTGNMITEEFCICDIKAHTFNQYPYNKEDRSSRLLQKFGDGYFESKDVKKVDIRVGVRNGLIQTGIRYVNAENSLVVAKTLNGDIDNIDFSIFEFCGNSMADEKKFKEYELISIETNYEKNTLGKRFSYSTGKEIVEDN